jgi:hypothetical protein
MNRAVKYVLAANLIGLTILTFIYPNLMVGPGKLIVGHQDLEEDCFACHAPFVGATAERCVTCHKPADIGRLTTAALPIAKPLTSTPFHQQLIKDDCMACHSDHAGVKRYRHAGRFNHDLLRVAARNECQTCHRAPQGLDPSGHHRQLRPVPWPGSVDSRDLRPRPVFPARP